MPDSSKPPVRRVSNKRTSTPEKAITTNEETLPTSPADAEQPSPKKQNRRHRNKPRSAFPKEIEVKRSEPETPLETPPPTTSHKPSQERIKIDPEALSKKAWKIFLAEVSEEGVSLISDNDAKELSRRCFRLAKIFLEQQQSY